jgi:hypothetical protein
MHPEGLEAEILGILGFRERNEPSVEALIHYECANSNEAVTGMTISAVAACCWSLMRVLEAAKL